MKIIERSVRSRVYQSYDSPDEQSKACIRSHAGLLAGYDTIQYAKEGTLRSIRLDRFYLYGDTGTYSTGAASLDVSRRSLEVNG